MIPAPPIDVLNRLKAALGEGGWSEDADRIAPKLVEWRGRWRGQTPLLLLPKDVQAVSAAVGICFEAGVAITPQGGNTGLVAGQIPQGELLLSLERMAVVREVEPFDDVAVVEAGVTLAALHEAAAGAGRSFPLSLASEGSATIGGLISTNAGGTAVLRYGTMRNLVLGIEAVLPNGEVYAGLKRLRKDNTGYDLKQLLIGAEGTLGVVTAASLKLFPILASRATAMAGLARAQDAIALLALAKQVTGGELDAFEMISRSGVVNAVRNIPGVRDPLSAPHDWLVLIETASGQADGAQAAMAQILERALEQGLIQDAVLAQSSVQAAALWKLREEQSAAQKPEGVAWKHDIAVPVSQVARFLGQAGAAAASAYPGVRIVAFGHVGDGNIHYDVIQPPEAARPGAGALHDRQRDEGSRMVHDIAAALGGSISAEHGLGAMKARDALVYKTAAEVQALRAVRAALDPKRIMNPRVLF